MQQPDTEPEKNNIGNQLCVVLIALIILILVACSSDNNKVVNTEQERPTSVPELNSAAAFNGPLVKAGATSVTQFIKNGVYSATYDYAYSQRIETSLPPGSPTASEDTADLNFSTTNTQEVGVDEADRIKYNGSALYVSAFSEWKNEQQIPAHIRVLERQNDDSLAATATISLDSEFANVAGIYEHNHNLAVLSNTLQMYTLRSFAPEPWFAVEDKLSIDIYDTSTPASPVVKSHVKIDGTLLSSRRIGDNLFIVSGYTAPVDGLDPYASTEQELLANYLTILDTDVAQLMPKIYFDDATGIQLIQPNECVIPAQATDKDGYAHLLTVIRINMLDQSDYSASCISSVAEVMYMSQDNIYLTASVNNQTVVHKVALDADLTYQATGVVDGIIGWRSAPNLRLSEYNDHLRIVSSDYSTGEPEHRLSVLSQQGNILGVVGTLPNEQAPDPIGKPGEDIYAVRFFADRAYVVTFERIDPLYVIDLAIPTAPKVIGELEIPGFSNYLYPLDNGYLVGVGQQVNTRNIPENGVQPSEPVTQEGMKISLFDITEPAAPIEVNSIVTANSYTPVEYDYHALTVLNTAGHYKFALPVETWGNNETSDSMGWWSQNSLALLEVDTNATRPTLIKRGELVVKPDHENYIYGGQDRSVIHEGNIYYIHGNQVWHSLWAEDAALLGPY